MITRLQSKQYQILHFGTDLVHKIGLAMNVKDHFCLAVAFGKASLDAFYQRTNQKKQRHLLSSFWKIKNKKVFMPGQIFFTVDQEHKPNFNMYTDKYVSVVHWLVIKRIKRGGSLVVSLIESEYVDSCIKVGTKRNTHAVNTRISKPIKPYKMIGLEYTVPPRGMSSDIEYMEPCIFDLYHYPGQEPPPCAIPFYSWQPYILHVFVNETLDRGPTVIADYGVYAWLLLDMRVNMANLVEEIYNVALPNDWQTENNRKREYLKTEILRENGIRMV